MESIQFVLNISRVLLHDKLQVRYGSSICFYNFSLRGIIRDLVFCKIFLFKCCSFYRQTVTDNIDDNTNLTKYYFKDDSRVLIIHSLVFFTFLYEFLLSFFRFPVSYLLWRKEFCIIIYYR